MKYILLVLIRIYQFFLSFDHGIPHKLFPNYRICIYEPSCSAFGYESIKRYGSIYGTKLTAQRILRCTPAHEGGYDPVPDLEFTGWRKFLTKI